MDGALEYMDKYVAAGGVGVPPQADTNDTVPTREELTDLGLGARTSAEKARRRELEAKIAANPTRGDVARMLHGTCRESWELTAAYTPEVHAKFVQLIGPVKALIHDVDDENRGTLLPPVRAIGIELDRLGGFKAQQAVYYGMNAILHGEVAYCNTGPWSNLESTLNIAWDGIGKWMS